MLLSEEEISQISLSAVTVKDATEDVRAIEAAILAKLASAELPEPAYVVDACVLDRAKKCCRAIHCTRREGVYTATQLQQARAQGFAAGAAAQLSAEPVFFAYQYDDGTWHDGSATEHSVGMKHLYTRREA